MNSAGPWIDNPSCCSWVAKGLFAENGGRVLQLYQQGFCLFHPKDPNWLAQVDIAFQQLSISNSSASLKNLFLDQQILDHLSQFYGRKAYASCIEEVNHSNDFCVKSIAQKKQTNPSGFVCGVIIALQDVGIDQAPLCLYPNTHCDFSFNAKHPYILDVTPDPDCLKPLFFRANRGDVLVIHSNLLYSYPSFDNSESLYWSPMCTYLFEGCQLIDLDNTARSGFIKYRKSSDLKTFRLRPSLRDKILAIQPASQKPVGLERANHSGKTGIPLIDRKDFKLTKSQGGFGTFTQLAQQLNKKGFGLLEIKDPDWLKLVSQVRKELEPHVDLMQLKSGKLGPTRFQDAWLHQNVDAVRQVAIHPEIMAALQVLYGRVPFPFQTLNFPNGTAQHVHSDAVHFHSFPHGFMCGVWVALEDVSLHSGPLVYYPGSHRLPYLSASDFGLTTSKVLAEPHPQKFFESHWRRLLRIHSYPRRLFKARKGDVLIWHANLLHGGSSVKDKTMTRWSQVTHYFFEECTHMTPLLKTIDSTPDGPHLRLPSRTIMDMD